ncbi:MAG TPA: universal stress protein [Gemmatimonadaceae bacterium]|nr:universal stress protein [Gemmatimonadaceae bacterium]
MYSSILVPLDGSPFAEQAIPVALTAAEASHAKVTLMRAWDPANYRYSSELTPPFLQPGVRDKLAAMEYLDAVAARLRQGTTVPIGTALMAGSAAEAIRECLTSEPHDLIVMTTHGLTGLSRAWIGSVSDAVVRTVNAPVLLVRPLEADGVAPAGRFERVLVPLDGSSEAEEILTHAAEVGGNARFILLRVERPAMIPLRPYAYAASAWKTDDEATQEVVTRAYDYLNRVARSLEARRPGAKVDVDVRFAERPAVAIVEAALDYKADLVALTTHARRAARWVFGSAADKILRGTHGSVLLLRPAAVAAGDDRATVAAGAAAGQ